MRDFEITRARILQSGSSAFSYNLSSSCSLIPLLLSLLIIILVLQFTQPWAVHVVDC